MVEIATRIQTQSERMRARAQRVRDVVKPPGVRVTPANDDMRRLLKHPRAGGFRSEGSMEWPNDRFTQRRLRDGDIKIEEKKEERNRPAHHARRAVDSD
jgi:hypothetical protein